MTSPIVPLTLGEFLRSEREKRGLSLEQVAAATKIGFRILHSMEADQFEDLPAKPFIRGFIISYCRFIGVDAKEVLARYSLFIDDRSKQRPNREAQFSGYAFEKREADTSRTFLWIVMTLFLVLGGIFVVVFKPVLKSRHHGGANKLRELHATPSPGPSKGVAWAHNEAPVTTPSTTPSPLPTPSLVPSPHPVPTPSKLPSPRPSPSLHPSPKPSPSPSPSPTPSAAPVSSAPNHGLSAIEAEATDPLASGKNLPNESIHHRLVVKALADVWVRYRSDGRPVMKFVLIKDKVLVIRASELIQFQASNVNAVRTTYNQKAWKLLREEPKLRRIDSTGEMIFKKDSTWVIPSEFQVDSAALPITADPVSQPE